MSSTSRLFLHDHPMSSYAQKVRMALRLKNIPFTSQTPQNLGSGQPDPAFLAANPRMEVPALLDGDFAIFDSATIVAYLEDKFPERPLFPPDPRGRAEARMIDDVCATHYEAINWAVGEVEWFGRAEGAERERLLSAAREQTAQVQEWLEQRLGSKAYFQGDEIGYADLSVAPIVNRSVFNGFGPKEGSALQKWHARVSTNPAVRQTFDEAVEAATKLKEAGPALFAAGAGRRREYRDHRLEFMVKNGGIEVVERAIKNDTIRFSWPHPK